VQVTAYGRQTVPDRGVVRSCDPLQNFGGSNHITGMAEPKVVTLCTRVGYMNSNNRVGLTYHQQKGRGYGHTTVLKFLANVNLCSSLLYAIAVPSVCLSVVCCLSVTLVRPTQPVEIFGNFSSPSGTLAIHWHSLKISRRSSQTRPFDGGFKRKRGSDI